MPSLVSVSFASLRSRVPRAALPLVRSTDVVFTRSSFPDVTASNEESEARK